MCNRARDPRCLLAASVLWIVCGSVSAQAVVDNSYDIKGAFLYNFAIFTEWPKDAVRKDAVDIGIVGKDPDDAFMKQVTAKKANGKPIVVKRFKTIEDVSPCHVLFLAEPPETAAAQKLNAEKLSQVRKKAPEALIVTEAPGLALQGSMVNFYLENNHVKFEVNLSTVKSAGLKISSRVLDIGKIVGGK